MEQFIYQDQLTLFHKDHNDISCFNCAARILALFLVQQELDYTFRASCRSYLANFVPKWLYERRSHLAVFLAVLDYFCQSPGKRFDEAHLID